MNKINAETAKLAGLQIDLLEKLREGLVTLEQLEKFNLLSLEERERIFGSNTDPWLSEKRKIEKFYKKFFNRTIDWSVFSLPKKTDRMNRLEVSFADLTEDQIFSAYAKKIGENSVWKYYESISKAIESQQERPAGDYAFCHVGGEEPDLLGKSYDDGIEAVTTFMVPKEGLVAAFRFRVETGKMYDVVGLTRFAALDGGGDAMFMFRDGSGRFIISSDFRDFRNPQCGLRQVVLLS